MISKGLNILKKAGKRTFNFIKEKALALVGAATLAGASVMASTGTALAELTTEQQAVVTNVTTMISDLTTVAWSLVLSLVGLFVGIKLFKKVFGKAT